MPDTKLVTALEDMACSYINPLDKMLDLCESPIEKLFLIRLYGDRISMMDFIKDYIGIIPQCAETLEIDGEFKSIRIDFLLNVPNRDIRIAIECDGHDFHEKTKEQASADKARDFGLQKKGLYILRFSGSDIHNKIDYCVRRVWELLDSIINKGNKNIG